MAQTGPDGTMMSFSIDFRVVGDLPSKTQQNVCVIQRAKGTPFKLAMPMTSPGEIQVLVPGWKPEEGPFTAHIEDPSGNRLSGDLTLQQTGT